MDTEKVFNLETKTENLNLIFQYLEEILEEQEVSFKVINSVEVAFEEIFSNICNYAYGDTVGNAKITITTDNKVIKIKLEDQGIQYDPFKKEDPDINAAIEDRPIGGLGIFLVKQMMDNFEYNYEKGKNINILTKNLFD